MGVGKQKGGGINEEEGRKDTVYLALAYKLTYAAPAYKLTHAFRS